jgi:hypothetical protein
MIIKNFKAGAWRRDKKENDKNKRRRTRNKKGPAQQTAHKSPPQLSSTI